MEEQKISIIVPVYKVEAYLDRCVRSIVGQTYQNLEIILVDDGSPDNCPAMCDAWAEKDSRIRVIHQKNGGLSAARNAGMAAATGTLMGFIDSDDWIEPEMYQLLRQHMEADQADIAACGVEMVWEDDTPSRMLTPSGCRILSREEAMRSCVLEDWLKQPVWYKLYQTRLIRSIPFPAGKCHEDVFWSYLAVGAAERVTVFGTPCYHYVQRCGSIMGAGYSLKRLDALEAKARRHPYICAHYPALTAVSAKNLWFSCLYHGQLALQHLPAGEQKQVFNACGNFLRCCPLSDRIRKDCSKKEQLWLTMARVSLPMTCRLRSWLKIGL